jgi:hypothetical protein
VTSLANLRSQLASLRAQLPAIQSNDGGPARNARRLACIEAAPEGPARDFTILACVLAAAGVEEPEALAALLAAIGPERIALAFPNGDVPEVCPNPDLRARARAWQPAPGTIDPITAMICVWPKVPKPEPQPKK